MITDTINDAVTRAGGAGALLAGRYRVLRQLGQGGMGSVWLAEDTQLDNKPFAIKMLPSILVSNKRAYRQLKDEALVAMQLVHPNIVQIRAFEENNGNPFLVMDYVDGQTLDDYLADYGSRVEHVDRVDGIGGARRPAEPVGSRLPRDRDGRARSPSGPPGGLSEADVLRILRPIAAALDYAHAKGVVHRDVKPGNVMVAKDGTPYILDFGIAREIQETMTRVTGKLSSGTLLYMSPEQLMGESPKPAQDIYSFAAMAYECLKGEPPFVRGAIEDQIKNKRPDPPPGGTQLVASVMAGLAKKPEDRPATCAAVLEGNNLTQRRREAESQGGRARSPSGPHGNGFSRVEHVERVDGLGGARRPAEPVVRRVPTPPQSGGARSRATAQTTEGPRFRAAVTGLLAAALLVVLAGGAWWLVNARTARSTGTTGVSPVVTDADVVAIAVEASVQKDRIARLDDADGFKEKKDEISGLLTRATSYGKAKRYKESAQAFSNYVAECRELVRLDVERKSALKDKAKAQEALQMAESSGAKTYAVSSWNTAVDVWRQASEQFGRMEFSRAGRTFSSAAELFGKCAGEVKTAKVNEAATRIQEAESYLKSLQKSMADIDQVRAMIADKTAPKNLPLRSRIGEAYDVYNKARMERARLLTSYTDQHPKVQMQDAVIRTAFSNMQNVIAQALRSLTTIRQAPDELTALERDIFTFEFFKENIPQHWQGHLGGHYEAYCKARAEKQALLISRTPDHPEVAVASNRVEVAIAAFKGVLAAFKGTLRKDDDRIGLKQDVLCYRRDVPGGEVLTKENLGIISIFVDGLKGYAVETDVADVLGRKLNVAHRAGDVVFWSDIEGGHTGDARYKEHATAEHEKVQLWEGGPYWATTNIGAEKPEDSGYYFWWGDTVGYKREGDAWVASDGSQSNFSFDKDSVPTCGKDIGALKSGGWITSYGVLAPEHDAAHVHWGGDWRMPTKQELDGLSRTCDRTWTTRNGVKGYEVRGRGAYVSASIFLPCAGYGFGTSLNDSGSDGYFWSSVPNSGSYDAYELSFVSGYPGTYSNYRYDGQSVRPVQGFTK